MESKESFHRSRTFDLWHVPAGFEQEWIQNAPIESLREAVGLMVAEIRNLRHEFQERIVDLKQEIKEVHRQKRKLEETIPNEREEMLNNAAPEIIDYLMSLHGKVSEARVELQRINGILASKREKLLSLETTPIRKGQTNVNSTIV